MKLIDTSQIPKTRIRGRSVPKVLDPPIPVRSVDEIDKDLLPPEWEAWKNEHFISHSFGIKTSAWCGLCWADGSGWLDVSCGCGSRFIQRIRGGPVTIDTCPGK